MGAIFAIAVSVITVMYRRSCCFSVFSVSIDGITIAGPIITTIGLNDRTRNQSRISQTLQYLLFRTALPDLRINLVFVIIDIIHNQAGGHTSVQCHPQPVYKILFVHTNTASSIYLIILA